jgi:hypothetical protein
MEVGGLCHICGRPSSHLNSCRMCGALVCGKCYDQKTGLCVNCAARRGGKVLKPGIEI